MLSRYREWRGVWLALSIAVVVGIALVLSVGKIYSPAVIRALNGSMKTEFNEKVLSSLATFDPEYFVTALAWSPDGKYLAASVNGDVRVLIFDVDSREVVKSEWKPTTGGRSISFTPEGEYILTPSSNYPDGKNDYSLILIDRRTGAFLQRVEGPYPGDRSFARRNVASKFALSPDHKWLLAAVDLRNPGLALYDLVTLTVTKTIPFPKGADGIAWRPDSQAVAIMAGGTVRWLSVPDLVELQAFKYFDTGGSVVYSPDGKLLAVGRAAINTPFDPKTLKRLPIHEGAQVKLIDSAGALIASADIPLSNIAVYHLFFSQHTSNPHRNCE